MNLYSDYPGRRARQIAGDVLALVLIVISIALGKLVYGLVHNLARFGVQVQGSGSQLRTTMSDIGERLGGVPLIGSGIRSPFTKASEAAAALERAGQDQQQTVHHLGVTLGVGTAVVPIAIILVVWLVPRVRFARRAATIRSFARSASPDLLALRALARADLRSLSALHPDVARAWRDGDETVIASLAGLELRAAGVRLHSPERSAG